MDREKVIKGLKCCAHIDGNNCKYCPYDITYEDCTDLMAKDAMELLKEMEKLEERHRILTEACETMLAEMKETRRREENESKT